ncbi:MAG: nuclear transport factor 2 family protein [Opitutaceae bacterium]
MILFVVVCLAQPGPVRAASPEHEAVRTLVQRFLKCWETGDVATFESLLHPQLSFGYPGGRMDRATLVATFKEYQAAKKDIRIYFGDAFISDGKKHCINYQFAATDRASGKRFAVGTGVMCELSEGKIIGFREYWDTRVAEAQKIGELPLDEGVVTPWPGSVWLRKETIN